MDGPDHLDADRFSAMGDAPLVVVDARTWRRPVAPMQALVIGTDRTGSLPDVAVNDFDLLVTSAASPPRPWVGVAGPRFDARIAALAAAVQRQPFAATIAAQQLRLAEQLPLADALAAESLAYSALLGGAEFGRWREARRLAAPVTPTPVPCVRAERTDNSITLTLADPENRNAMTAAMRDGLYEALANCLDDPSAPLVSLRGDGRCFSTGGDLAEFGTAADLAAAHVIRTLRSCARALDALGPRAEVRLHGACVGSGIEIAAAAHRRIAAPDAWFQLPELSMGLIPGAGGTVTIGRAIGRHRTMWMLLTGQRLDVRRAQEWGLVHAIEAPR